MSHRNRKKHKHKQIFDKTKLKKKQRGGGGSHNHGKKHRDSKKSPMSKDRGDRDRDRDSNDWNSDTSYDDEHGQGTDDAISCVKWSSNNEWIITGHINGEIKFYNKQFFINPSKIRNANVNTNINSDTNDDIDMSNVKVKKSKFYYQYIGSLRRHAEQVTSLALSGTYLVSSSNDGSIILWHLDFLLPSLQQVNGGGGSSTRSYDNNHVRLNNFLSKNSNSNPHSISNSYMNLDSNNLMSRDMIQMLAKLDSAHLGDEVNDIQLSNLTMNANYCIPNALYLASAGSDNHVRCRDVMGMLLYYIFLLYSFVYL